MKTLSVIFALLAFTATAQSTEIAVIDFDSIEPILEELVLSKSRNSDLNKSIQESNDYDALPSDPETDENGNLVFKTDLKSAMAQARAFEVRQDLRDEMRRELLLIISDLDLTFDLIIDSSQRNAVIFSTVDPSDITQRIYQEVVFRLATSEKSASENPPESANGPKPN